MDRYVKRLALEAGQDQKRLAPCHTLFSHPHCLESIFEQASSETLLSLTLVSRSFHYIANDVIWRREISPSQQLATFLQENPAFGQRLKSLHITRPASSLSLPQLCPRLRFLTIGPDAHITASSLVDVLSQMPQLESLTLIGMDARGRRRRNDDPEPEGQASQALAMLSADNSTHDMLPGLRHMYVKSTPIKLGSLEHFLHGYGRQLESLELEGCSVGYLAIELIEAYCPRLRHLRLDAYMVTTGPPSTPRPNAPPPDFDRAIPLTFSSYLTSIHLSSLPTLDAEAFALFGQERSGGTLRSLSISHCDITAVHLSHFSFVTKLRLVSTPKIRSIPVYPDQSHPDVGRGMKELRQVSVLGCHGITLGNVWEMMQLGKDGDEVSTEDVAIRKRLGLGRRGLQKLTIDGTGSRGYRFRVSGVDISVPAGLGARPMEPDLESDLPEALSPPSQLEPYLGVNILSPSLPSAVLLAVIVAGQDLEHFGLYGSAPGFSNPLDMIAIDRQRTDNERQSSAYMISKLKTLLAWFPLAAWYFPPKPPPALLPEPLKFDECYIASEDWASVSSRRSAGAARARSDGRTGAGSTGDGARGGSTGGRLSPAQVRWVKEAGSGKLTSLRV